MIKSGLITFTIALLLALFLPGQDGRRSHIQRDPAQATSGASRGWRLSLYDNFSEPEVAAEEAKQNSLDFDASCYSRPPRCEYIFWDYHTCGGWDNPQGEIYRNLKGLNKCRWTIYNTYNWMDFGIAEGEGVNSFHASQVAVKDGYLHLKANKNPDWAFKKDCKNKKWSGEYSNYSTDCPIYSGAVRSEPWGSHDEANDKWEMGFEQPYGRWEVRAKMPEGAGIWPGLWMIPMGGKPNPDPVEHSGGKVDCGWPHSGEIDVLETWSDDPNKASQGFIQGNCEKDIDMRLGFDRKGLDLVHQFHTYGVQWDLNTISFYVDDKITGTIQKGDKLKSKYRSGPFAEKAVIPREEAWIPSYPFYWILNLSIEGTKSGDLKPNYETWSEKEVTIDYVKVYRRCTQEEYDADAKRADGSKLCSHFGSDTSGADVYQSTRNETASAEMFVYPNPYVMGTGEISVEFKLDQNCQDVKIDIVAMTGQIVSSEALGVKSASPEIIPSGRYLHDGPLRGDRTNPVPYSFRFTPPSGLAAAMYLIRAEFKKCADSTGFGEAGHGNYVWKEVIAN